MKSYTTATLLGVVTGLELEPTTALRDKFFSDQIFFDTEEVHFDLIDKTKRLAPFVSPLVKGKVIDKRGYTTKYFRPAYVKAKHAINPADAVVRGPGEAIGGSLSPEERRDISVRNILQEHVEMLDMREEVMVAEFLRTGKITVEGEGFGKAVLDFGRHSDLTVTLAGAAKWDGGSADPRGNLDTWMGRVRDKSNAVVQEVWMSPDAFAAFLAKLTADEKKLLLDSLRGSESKVELGLRLKQKLRYEGRIGQLDIWTYADSYTDDNGAVQQLMPSGTVLLPTPAIEGVRGYGAILDAQQLRSARLWPKMWEEQDPSLEYLMTQSAPIVAPRRVNACLGAKVL